MEFLQVLAVVCMFSQMSWGHGGHHEGAPLKFSAEIHNKDHIIEHLQRQIATKPKDQMSDEELEFHYFKLHDYDNNNKLDGVEIGKALTHFHDESEASTSTQQKAFSYEDDEIVAAVDEAMKDDMDDDGYVEYYEFSLSQKMARSADPRLGRGIGIGGAEGESAGNARPPSWKVDADDDWVSNLNNVVARGARPSAMNRDSDSNNNDDIDREAKPPGWTPEDDGSDDDELSLENLRRHQPRDGQTQARQQQGSPGQEQEALRSQQPGQQQ